MSRNCSKKKTQKPNRVKTNYRNNNKEHQDQEKVKMFYKDGNSTMLFCRMSFLAAKCLEATIVRYCENHNVKLTGKFIFAQ